MRYPMSSSRQNPRDVHRSPLRPGGPGLGRLLAALVILGGLASGAPAQPQKGAVANPEAVNQSAVLSATSTGATAARQFQCLSRDAQGNCTRNKCTRGPGGQFYDCGSFAQACKNAGLDWTGSREGDEAGGVCSVKKKAPQ